MKNACTCTGVFHKSGAGREGLVPRLLTRFPSPTFIKVGLGHLVSTAGRDSLFRASTKHAPSFKSLTMDLVTNH